MPRWLCVYIMASYSRCLYTGVTNDLVRRVWQHRERFYERAFSAQYRTRRLVYYEFVEGPLNAIAREKQIKRWSRRKRVDLIERANPGWRDLASRWPEIELLDPGRCG